MNKDLNLFNYTVVDNQSTKTLFLLHGTGGTQDDFLFLDDELLRHFNLVGLKGNVDEDGMTRFFRRLNEGVFDQKNIQEESQKLYQFITAWMQEHKTKEKNMYFLGYSNGANMLLATLFYYPQTFTNVTLLHPMLPFKPKGKLPDLSACRIFVSMGEYDQMISYASQLDVVNTLKACKANLTVKEYPSGHEITKQELVDIISYLG